MTRQQPTFAVGREGILLPAGLDDVLNVLFDGRRVFSVAPQHHRRTADGRRHVKWPSSVAPFLRGRSAVAIRTHAGDSELFAEEVVFDETDARVNVVDDEGYPLTLTKWGSLTRPFDVVHAGARDQLVDDLRLLLAVLNDDLGVDAFVAYGTLLGAVRGGSLIAHDDDADIAYLSRSENPADVARESFALQRALADRGWWVERRSGAFIKVARSTDAATQRTIDVFAAYFMDEMFAIERWIRTRLPRRSVTPLSQVSLERVLLPAPGRPEDVLAATYGPQWRVPDPAFRFQTPRSVLRRSNTWFGAWMTGHRHWEGASAEPDDAKTLLPSTFARWVEPQLGNADPVVDLGCGTGRDAAWFAARGETVVAVDYVPEMLSRAAERAREAGVSVRFQQLTLYDLRTSVAAGAQVALAGQTPALYARRLLGALRPDGRFNLWQMARTALGGGGRLFLEFRAAHPGLARTRPRDSKYETPLDAELVAAEIEARGGVVERSQIAHDERGDQFCRMATSWGRPA